MSTMKASIKGKYDVDKNNSSALTTLAVKAGDAKIKLSATEATFSSKGPSLQDLILSLEKPGQFIIDYYVPRNDFRFQFMKSVNMMGKSANMTYIHFKGDNRTTLEGSVSFDSANKISWNWTVGTRSSKVKYAYSHGESRETVFEPSYDFGKHSFDFTVSRKIAAADVVKGTYQPATKNLRLEWSRDSKVNSSFKILASTNLDQPKAVKLTAETTWNYEISWDHNSNSLYHSIMDHYKTLGLSRDATKEEIKTAFRRCAFEFHPDRHTHSTDSARELALSRFKKASEAYEVLIDDSKRAGYDRFGYDAGFRGRGGGGRSSYSNYNNYGYAEPGYGGRSSAGINWAVMFRYMTSRRFAMNVFYASALLCGTILVETAGKSLWEMNNSGKSFEDAMESIETVKAQKDER